MLFRSPLAAARFSSQQPAADRPPCYPSRISEGAFYEHLRYHGSRYGGPVLVPHRRGGPDRVYRPQAAGLSARPGGHRPARLLRRHRGGPRHRPGHCGKYTNRDDGNFDDDGSMFCWVDIDIPAASTTLYLSDMQFGVMDAKSLSGQHVSPNVQIYASVKYKNGNTIGSVDLSNGNAQITIPTAGTVRLSITVSCNYGVTDWNGRAYVSFQGFPISETANNTVIAKDGIMATFNGNYMRMHSSEGFSVKVGNNYFRITSSGIQKSTNGSTWTNL